MQLPDKHPQRFRDRRLDRELLRLLPGDYYVSTQGEALTTVLGSCVSACIRDTRRGIGGMNHYMLPNPPADEHTVPAVAGRYGTFAMAYVLERLTAQGARPEDLEIKLFGGGRIIDSAADVGQRNIDFVRRYLADAGIHAEVEDLGLTYPRKIVYFTDTGKVMVKKLRALHSRTVAAEEAQLCNEMGAQPLRRAGAA